MKHATFPVLLAASLQFAFCLALAAEESVELPALWKAQPATSSSVPPDPANWGECKSSALGPSCWRKTKFSALPMSQIDSAWLENEAAVPASWAGARILLDFERIEGDALIFVNGAKAGELLRPGGEIEITSLAKPGETNSVRVFCTRSYVDISRNFEQDLLRHAARTDKFHPVPKEKWAFGVSAPVSLVKRPSLASISDVAAQASVRQKSVRVNLEIESAKPLSGLSARIEAFSLDGAKEFSAECPAFESKGGAESVSFEAEWPNPRLWELDDAQLYLLKTTLLLNGKAVDEAKPFKFGFREIWTEGRKLVLNGHECRFRLAAMWNVATKGAGNVDLARLIGYNAGYIQANSGLWWRSWSETPVYDDALLERADERGFALFLPLPSADGMANEYVKNTALRQALERETRLFLKRYKNHPGILGWMVSMNGHIGDLYKESQTPVGLGRKFTEEEIKASATLNSTNALCKNAKEIDPTRLAFAHAEGGVGDVATSNVYLNFVPLQEREEWPMRWSREGEAPFMSVETGQPHIGNFWKGKRFLLTEYLAMYFGEDAYLKEPEKLLADAVRLGTAIDSDGQGDNITDKTMGGHPLYWDFQKLFVGATNKAWRGWGLNGGWSYWVVTTHYGMPPGEDPKQGLPIVKIYNKIPKGLSAKPAWANENFDIHSQANKPLLACLAGFPRQTDKTHSFLSGESVEKSLLLVWDGPGETEVSASWRARKENGAQIASGEIPAVKLAPGSVKQIPFKFTAPQVDEKTSFIVELSPKASGQETPSDSFRVEVWPQPKQIAWTSKAALFDPAGKSSKWLASLGVKTSPWNPGDSLEPFEVLIIGAEALRPGCMAPYSAADIERGLKVLLLEQKPEVWRGLGFRTTESMARILYQAWNGSPALSGLGLADLRYWRGDSELLPEGKTQPSEVPHAPKWTNTHGVSSSTPQVPRVAGFVPHLQCEFDLDYSPLLEWRAGKGALLVSSLDFSGRAGKDPAATKLAANLLSFVDSLKPEGTRFTVCRGDEASLALFRKLGVDTSDGDTSKDPAGALFALGENSGVEPEAVLDFAKRGGVVFALPQKPEWLAKLGFKTSHKPLWQAFDAKAEAKFEGLSPKLLRWRDALSADLFEKGSPAGAEIFCEGAIASESVGKGAIVLCQISPRMILDKFKDDKAKAEAVDLSAIRLEQLVALLLTHCGAEPSKETRERLCAIAAPPSFKAISSWQVFGPFFVDKDDGDLMLSTKFPGEELAIKGTPDPNFTVKREDGKELDWHAVAKASENGHVNLAPLFNRKSLAVGYAVTTVESESERDAVLRLGCDWRMTLWKDGEEIFRTTFGKNRPDSYRVNVHLKKGANKFGVKLGSGSNGFSFYADISGEESGVQSVYSNDMKASAVLYGGALQMNEFDPYIFRYW